MERRRKENRSQLYESQAFLSLADRLAKNLRRLRLERDWSQERAAEACELPFKTYQPLEYGRANVSLITLSRLGEGFGVEASSLLRKPRGAAAE